MKKRAAYVGKVIEHGTTSTLLDYGVLCDMGFPHVIGVFGNRGSGKSFDLGVFLEELFANSPELGDTERGDAGIVFDIQDQFWTLAYAPDSTNREDARQLDELRNWGLDSATVPNVSLFAPAASDTVVPHAKRFTLAASQLTEDDFLAMLGLGRFSPMGQALLTVLDGEGPKPPDALARACASSGVLRDYQQVTVDGLRWRLESVGKTSIIGETGVCLDGLLRPRGLSVILMRNLPDSIRALIVGVISRLACDRMGRVQQARRVARRVNRDTAGSYNEVATRLWTVLDEAHILVPSDGATAATGPLIDYVKRGRDAGLSLIFATQQPSAVNSKLMSQVDITLTHMLGFEADLTAAIGRMPTRSTLDYEVDSQKAGTLADVIRSLAPGEAVLADAASPRAFLMKVRPRRTAHGGDTPE